MGGIVYRYNIYKMENSLNISADVHYMEYLATIVVPQLHDIREDVDMSMLFKHRAS
jgi:hypothetical protein